MCSMTCGGVKINEEFKPLLTLHLLLFWLQYDLLTTYKRQFWCPCISFRKCKRYWVGMGFEVDFHPSNSWVFSAFKTLHLYSILANTMKAQVFKEFKYFKDEHSNVNHKLCWEVLCNFISMTLIGWTRKLRFSKAIKIHGRRIIMAIKWVGLWLVLLSLYMLLCCYCYITLFHCFTLIIREHND